MDFTYARAVKPAETAVLALKTVYNVQADSSYDVYKQLGAECQELVVFRTLRGTGSITLAGLPPQLLCGNTLFICAHNQVRRYFCQGDVWEFWWFEFAIKGNLVLPVNTVLQVGLVEQELADCTNCLALLRKEDNLAQALASATMSRLLASWLFAMQERKQSCNPYQEAIEALIAELHSNPSEKLTVTAMAKKVGLSERRFRQVFAQVTGKQPKRFLATLKLEMARELLSNTSLSVTQIAERLGYSSPYHLSKAFHEFWGLPPRAFRQAQNSPF